MNATALPLSPSWSMRLLERDLLPDFLVRVGIRRLLKARLAEEDRGESEAQQRHLMKLIARLKRSPIAINTGDANLQHYELPSGFFERVLGPHLKYSSGYYRRPSDTLEQSEANMLALTAERARLKRWRADTRARLRLGFAVAVDGAALSRFAHHRGVQLAHPETLHRRARRGARP
jgi:hypothetical protein